MKKYFLLLTFVAFFISLAHIASASLVFPSVGDLDGGTLIKTASSSTVYYFADDEMRYGFPNEKTYFTWYDDFEDVVTISTSEMSQIPLGGMVTYKPQFGNKGVSSRLVKFETWSTVYVPIGEGMLIALKNEDNAVAIFGTSWKTSIDVLPDGFANTYLIVSGFLSDNVEFVEDNGYTIDDDLETSTVTGVMMYEDPLRFTAYDEKGDCIEDEICCTSGDYCGYNVVKVDKGDTIKFVNYTTETLTIREEDGLFTTGQMSPEDIVVMTINLDKGEYTFVASEDDDMVGVLVVE